MWTSEFRLKTGENSFVCIKANPVENKCVLYVAVGDLAIEVPMDRMGLLTLSSYMGNLGYELEHKEGK